MATMKCPCHSNKPYQECCKPLHDGSPAETPLQLMRSRYSAYALGNGRYIMQTTHPSHPEFTLDSAKWEKEIEKFTNLTQFIDLEILESDQTTVTFHATLKQGDVDLSFTEKSLFEKVGNQWLYKKRLE